MPAVRLSEWLGRNLIINFWLPTTREKQLSATRNGVLVPLSAESPNALRATSEYVGDCTEDVQEQNDENPNNFVVTSGRLLGNAVNQCPEPKNDADEDES
jgi:hypothetical protein